MDAYHKKKAIADQNARWLNRKPAKCNIDKSHHPWYFTTETVKKRIDKVSGFDPYNEELPRD